MRNAQKMKYREARANGLCGSCKSRIAEKAKSRCEYCRLRMNQTHQKCWKKQ